MTTDHPGWGFPHPYRDPQPLHVEAIWQRLGSIAEALERIADAVERAEAWEEEQQ